MKVTKVGEAWQFDNEWTLEELLWHNLTDLLKLNPFKRQYSVKRQVCDILALDAQRRLVVMELKNAEDRYVVQQLTRYYDALKKERPFEGDVDWEKPIRLIAIAPSFHSDTIIDCDYNKLDIELIRFTLSGTEHGLQLKLIDQESNTLSSQLVQASHPPLQSKIPITSPPRKLLNWVSDCSDAESQGIMSVREQILGFDTRIKEIVERQAIIYGKGKTKPCAEIRQRRIGNSKFVTLFLLLPDLDGSDRIFRMMIWSDESWMTVKTISYSPKACKTKRAWNLPHWLSVMPSHYEANRQQYQKTISIDGKNCVLESLVDLALQIWLTRHG